MRSTWAPFLGPSACLFKQLMFCRVFHHHKATEDGPPSPPALQEEVPPPPPLILPQKPMLPEDNRQPCFVPRSQHRLLCVEICPGALFAPPVQAGLLHKAGFEGPEQNCCFLWAFLSLADLAWSRTDARYGGQWNFRPLETPQA